MSTKKSKQESDAIRVVSAFYKMGRQLQKKGLPADYVAYVCLGVSASILAKTIGPKGMRAEMKSAQRKALT